MFTIRRHTIDDVLYLRAEDVLAQRIDGMIYLHELLGYDIEDLFSQFFIDCDNEHMLHLLEDVVDQFDDGYNEHMLGDTNYRELFKEMIKKFKEN